MRQCIPLECDNLCERPDLRGSVSLLLEVPYRPALAARVKKTMNLYCFRFWFLCVFCSLSSFKNARNTESAANAVATILNYLFDQAVPSYVTIHVDPSRNNCYLHSNRCCAECSGTIYVNSLPNTGAAVSYYNAEYSGVTIQHLQYTGASVSTYSAICSDTCIQSFTQNTSFVPSDPNDPLLCRTRFSLTWHNLIKYIHAPLRLTRYPKNMLLPRCNFVLHHESKHSLENISKRSYVTKHTRETFFRMFVNPSCRSRFKMTMPKRFPWKFASLNSKTYKMS